jgi:hypothetical protein
MLLDVCRFLSIYLVLNLFLYTLGFYTLKFFKNTFSINRFYTKIFLSLLVGLIFTVLVFSLVKSNFLTGCLFFPFILFITFYKKSIKFTERDSPFIKAQKPLFYLGILLILLFPFLWFSSVFLKLGDFHYTALAYDSVWYSELSNYLLETGKENKWGMFFSDTSSIAGVEPYHYVDSWLNAFCGFVFGGNSLFNFYLLTYPILILMTLLGFLAIIEHYVVISFLQCLVAVSLLFIGPVYQLKTQNYHFNTMACEIPTQHLGEKFAIYYPFIILSVLLVLNGYLIEALLFSLTLCVVSSTVFPAFIGFYLVLIFIKKANREIVWKSILFFSLYAIFFGFFKTKGTSTASSQYMLDFTDFESFSIHITWIKLALSNFGYGFFISLKYALINYIYAIPILFYLIFYKKNQLSKTLSLFIILNLVGLLMAGFFYKLPDAYQLFSNTLPFFHVVLITSVITILFNSTSTKTVLILCWTFLVLCFVNTSFNSMLEFTKINKGCGVSDDYVLKAQKTIEKTNNRQRIGFIYNQFDHDRLLLHPDSNYLYHLSYLGLNAIPYRLSLEEVSDSILPYQLRKSYKLLRENELYYSFMKGLTPSELNSDSLKIKFIRKFSLNYLLIGPTTPLPTFLSDTNSSILKDSKTGIRFVKLKNL